MKKLVVAIVMTCFTSVVCAQIANRPEGRETLEQRLLRGAMEGDLELVQDALDKGANIEAQSHGLTPLAIAVAARPWRPGTKEVKIVQLLLERGANVDGGVHGYTPLVYAVCYGQGTNLDHVKALLDHNANTEIADGDGDTPLICAASEGRDHFVKLLLDYGANIEAMNRAGATALFSAATGGKDHVDVVNLLLDHGANIEGSSKGKGGKTPLLQAAYFMSPRVVELLIKRGANITARDNQGRDALLRVCMNADGSSGGAPIESGRRTIGVLLKAGMDVNARDNDGYTCLKHLNSLKERYGVGQSLNWTIYDIQQAGGTE